MTAYPLSVAPSYYYTFDWLSAGKNRNGVFYAGDTVTLTVVPFTTSSDPHTADFETGTNGNTLSTSDRGSLFEYSTVAGSPVYDTVHAYGDLAMKCSAGGDYFRFAYAPSIGEEYVRFYAYFTGYPTVVGGGVGNLCATQVNGISMKTDGKIEIHDSLADLGGRSDTSANAIPLNQWVRFEVHWIYDNAAGGTFDLKIFHNANSTTATEQLTHTDWYTSHTGDINDGVYFGLLGGTWPNPAWFDNVGSLGADWWGPYATSVSETISYEILNYYGDIVSAGTFVLVGADDSFTPIVPVGGWDPGWYRCYLRGSQTDTDFGDSYGGTNFIVIRDDPNFVTMPDGPTTGGGAYEPTDLVMKGVMGIGTSRIGIADASDPNDPGAVGNITNALITAAVGSTYWPDTDAARPRRMWATTPNQSVDYLRIDDSAGVGTSGGWGRFYCKDETIDGSQVFVAVSSGTGANTDKVRIYSPNNVTLVETFDNLASAAAAQTAINAASNYVKFFNDFHGTRALATSVTVIGNDFWTGVIDTVTALYPAGVTHYEGPLNEPDVATYGVEIAHAMRIFQACVHAGDPAAQAIGPSPVNIDVASVEPFFAAGGGSYCDGIAFHAYNAIVNGEINTGRYKIQAFKAMLASYGLSALPLWQTESTGVFVSVYGIHHPRRARVPLLMTLLFEQEGVPKEYNNPWYDVEHGFPVFPAWIEDDEGALNPQAALYRTLSEEVYGKTHDETLDFGTPGNNIFLGSVYAGASDSTVVLMSASFLDNGSVTLTITGTTDALVFVDGFGNETTTAQTDGRVTVTLTDIPAYVRLPAGVSASVYSCNDWGAAGLGASLAATATTHTIGGVDSTLLGDGAFMTNYNYKPNTGMVFSTVPLPDQIVYQWDDPVDVGRVIIWGGPAWQAMAGLVDFDIDTTADGVTWVTQRTVTKDAPSSFVFGTIGQGCQRETYWDEQWIFDVGLDEVVSAVGVRVYVRDMSWGGEPDEDCLTALWGGQGTTDRLLAIQEVGIYDVAAETPSTPSSSGLTPVHPSGLALTPVAPGSLALVPAPPAVLT